MKNTIETTTTTNTKPKKIMRKRRTRELIKAETVLRFRLSEEERYMSSVFVTPMGQRKHEESVRLAYADYKRAGGTLDL